MVWVEGVESQQPWTEASGTLSEGLGRVLNPSSTGLADLSGSGSHISLQTNFMHPLTKLWHTKMSRFGCDYLLMWVGLRICDVQRGTTGDTGTCGASLDLQGKWGTAVSVGPGGAPHSQARISSRRGRWLWPRPISSSPQPSATLPLHQQGNLLIAQICVLTHYQCPIWLLLS